MATVQQCLEQVDDVFMAARDPSGAYLIRSRLRRTLLSCARLVAESTGATKPETPGVFPSSTGTSATNVEVLRLCERVYAIAGELCQPSESFDVRWEKGWEALREELDRLRALLQATTVATAA